MAPRSSRYLSLLAGVAVFVPFLRLGRRLAGERPARLAAFALAVSPLHLQSSTTAASEALYLLLMVTCLERLLAALERGRLRTFATAGLLASLAAVTRYDAWLTLPMVVVAAWLFARDRRAPGATLRGLLIFSAVAAALPLVWMAWSARTTHDPFFFAHYIASDHAALAAAVDARLGPLVARARQLGIWGLSFLAAMSLPLLGGAAVALRRFRGLGAPMKVVVVAALAAPAIYVAQGMLLLSFEPLARFALVPGTLLLPLAADALLRRWSAPRARLAIAVSAAAWSAAALLAAWSGPGRIWAGAESMGPLTRLDGEDRQLADYLRAHRAPRESVLIEPLAFSDIVIAHAARIPATLTVSLTITRTPEPTVAGTLARTGARWLAIYDGPGEPAGASWAEKWAADWPRESLRFGHWKLMRAP
jgi:4-amino-4-deoxy-L-arabinose transferase-like glycosyltransferase